MRYLSVTEIAKKWNVSERSVRNYCAQGRVPGAFLTGKKKQAIFFSLLRKVFIVVPLTYLLPYVFKMGTHGVFLAEPVSNVIGGSLCFVTMLLTILPELKRLEKKNGEADRLSGDFKTR